MPKTALYNMEGAAIGEVELSEEIFAAPINTAAMHLVVRSILANKRQGTQSALTARLSSSTAVSCLLPSPAITSSTFPRRSAALLSRAP